MLKKIFAPEQSSVLTDLALLTVRLWLGLTIFLNHGLAKLKGFSDMAPHFPDPIGLGHSASLGLAVFAEVVCAALLAVGLVTRLAALVLAINLGVAFSFVHQLALSGEHGGELAFIYLAGFFGLLLAGGGRFSIDKAVFGKA
jgi:putative oxidoreductase